MPGFDNHQGLWLLLLIPLLIFLDRWRSRSRTVVLSTFPLLSGIEPEPPKPPPLLFRVRRKNRVYIAAGVVLLASLAMCGAHLTVTTPRPSRLLVVLDNTMAMAEKVRDDTILDDALRAVGRVGDRLAKGSSLAVMTTGPRPRLHTAASPREVSGGLLGVRPSAAAPPVDELLPFVLSLAEGAEGPHVLVISARAQAWRDGLSPRQAHRVVVVPDADVRRGNAGIAAFDLRPSAVVPDSRDLYYRVATAGPLPSPPRLLLETADGVVRSLDAGAAAGTTLVGIALPDGRLTLSLAGTDSFGMDDRVEATVLSTSRIGVRLRGGEPGPLLTAIKTHEGFVLDQGEDGPAPDVDIFIDTATEALDRPSLAINPPGAFLGLEYIRLIDNPGPGTFHPSHPVTRDVSFWNFLPRKVLEFDPPEGFDVLARSGTVPLIFAGRSGGHRLVVWAFDPFASGLHLDPSFIILLRGSVGWLDGQRPADWDRLGCEGLFEKGGGTANLLCGRVSEEAGLLTVPNLDALAVGLPKGRDPERVNLSAALLLAAALLSLYLAIVNVYASESTL